MQLQTHSRYSLHLRDGSLPCDLSAHRRSYDRTICRADPTADSDPTHGSSVIAGIVDVTPQFGRVCEKSTVRLEGRYVRGVCPTRAW